MREKRRNMEEKNISCASHEAVAASQQKHGLTRRSFLKWAGVAATVPTLGQLVACAPQAKMADTGSDDAPAPALEDEGEWKPYRCFRLNCSASCINSDELTRIIGAYGNEAVMRAGLYPNPVLTALGGSQGGCGGNSQGGWVYPSSMMTGYQNLAGYYGAYLYNDRLDILNAKLIVLDGNNPSWSALGYPNKVLLDAKRRGAKIVGINPFYNSGLGAIADEWIPIRPATDAALFIGCAYHMIENDLQDQAFLDTYTVGFDADHMSEGADPKDNFKDYVLGTYDGVPKTPEWASEICGVEPEVIRSLATDMATIKPAAIFSCSAVTRGFRGEQAAQAFFTVG